MKIGYLANSKDYDLGFLEDEEVKRMRGLSSGDLHYGSQMMWTFLGRGLKTIQLDWGTFVVLTPLGDVKPYLTEWETANLLSDEPDDCLVALVFQEIY